MKLVKVKEAFYSLCAANGVSEELLHNEKGRPCVLIIQLKYKEKLRDFVIPMRSNISPNTPKWQFISLPPNNNTKPYHFHGIHYIKLFPINKSLFIDKYNVDKDEYYTKILKIIENKEKQIIEACQNYLTQCESGNKHAMTPNIDGILAVLDSISP